MGALLLLSPTLNAQPSEPTTKGQKVSVPQKGSKVGGRKGPQSRKGAMGLKGGNRARKGPPVGDAFNNVLRKIQQGDLRNATIELNALLERAPDHTRAMSLLGSTLGKLAFYNDAVALLDMIAGDEAYERRGLDPHADSLRMVGRGGEAASLRASAMVVRESGTQQLKLLLGMSADLRSVQAYELAADAALWAYGEFPRATSSHAELAMVELERGDPQQAESYLWLATLPDAVSSAQLHEARGRIALADGRLHDALESAALAMEQHPRALEPVAVYAQALRADGRPEEALDVLTDRLHPRQYHPEMIAAKAQALWDAGSHDEALNELHWGQATYPDHAAIIAAADHLAPPPAAAP